MLDERRYDIDALRSIALFLLIIYHLGQSFTSLAPYILFVQNNMYFHSFFVYSVINMTILVNKDGVSQGSFHGSQIDHLTCTKITKRCPILAFKV